MKTVNELRADRGLPPVDTRLVCKGDLSIGSGCGNCSRCDAQRRRDNTVFAYTPPGSTYPPYVNISRHGDGTYAVTVRSPAKQDENHGFVKMGTAAIIAIPREQLLELFKALAHELEVPISRRL